MDAINWLELLVNATLAACGGLVRRLAEKEKYPKRHIGATMFITSAVVSLFVGVVFYMACKENGVSAYLTMMITAMMGFFGTPAISWLFTRIAKETSEVMDTITKEKKQ